MTNSASDIRECLALADLYIRVIYTLIIAEIRHRGEKAVRLAASPGYGTMLAQLRAAAKNNTDFPSNSFADLIRTASQNLLDCNDQFSFKGQTFIQLRNRLSHGQSLPASDDEATTLAKDLRDLTERMFRELCKPFKGASLEVSDTHILLTSTTDSMSLFPTWHPAPNDGEFGLYSHYSAHKVTYIKVIESKTFDYPLETFSLDDRILFPQSNQNPTLKNFVNDVIRDIAAFTEDHTPPPYYFGDSDSSGYLIVPWQRPTSEDNQSRLDVFRIGKNNHYEWQRASGDWTGYLEFFRTIANWPLLARRIGQGLRKISTEREKEEIERLGSDAEDRIIGPSRLLQKSQTFESTQHKSDFLLQEQIDEACDRLRTSTRVFLIVGSAGLGKTELMLKAATERAEAVEHSPSTQLPLFLFVSSTGRSLESLEDAVDSALNRTKLLSSQSARALCRNGMLVLLVDGFDELLGSSGYENALGSLEPWFRDLGGRGVIVASARSSYYLTQYSKSLANRPDINAEHILAEIQPWNRREIKEYMIKSGTPEECWSTLSEREWLLLGIPFFARAFTAWHRKSANDQIKTIYDIVIEQYLDREGKKLTDHLGQPLLDHARLKALFAEISEMMQRSKVREIDQSDLRLCAEVVVGGDLDEERPGLAQRLTSICGLGVENSDRLSTQFGFSHEIMFDSFLSLALFRTFADTNSVLDLLRKSKIQSTVFDWIVERDSSAAKTCLSEILRKVEGSELSTSLSDNLGSWWMSLFNHFEAIPPTNHVWSLTLGNLELSNSGWSRLSFQNCSIERLLVPESGNQRIDITNSSIEVLECSDFGRLRLVLTNTKTAMISSLYNRRIHEDSPTRIREKLTELGLIERDAKTENGALLDSTDFFLNRLQKKSLTPIVTFNENRLPTEENPELNWILREGAEKWTDFVSTLINCDLAYWDPINSAGPPKSRLVFRVPASEISVQKNGDERVVAFWESLGIQL